MYFAHIALAAAGCVVFVEISKAEGTGRKSDVSDPVSEDESKGNSPEPVGDYHTSVAMIGIAFTDGSKKTCTGAVVHSNVVITAAHCFIADIEGAQPQMMESFVVIGTKIMYDSGYEQYLPIRKVITHPKQNGWTADLSLVFTFTDMISEKPGTILSLAGEKKSLPVDCNVTVASWGPMYQDGSTSKESSEDSVHNKRIKITAAPIRFREEQRSKTIIKPPATTLPPSYDLQSGRSLKKQKNPSQKQEKMLEPERHGNVNNMQRLKVSRYLTSAPERYKEEQVSRERLRHQSNDSKFVKPKFPYSYSGNSYYKDWRRFSRSERNRLSLETFHIKDLQSCIKIVENVKPNKYSIAQHDDVLCYTHKKRYLTDEDAGAPVIRRGQLVAVSVGGVKFEDEKFAVGMKISCYCSWIEDNLPSKTENFKCCKNCCNINNKEEKDESDKCRKKFNKV